MPAVANPRPPGPAAENAPIIAEPRVSMQTSPLVDIGINLAHDSYDHDRAEVVERAVAAGVARMVITGSSLESAGRAIDICRRWPTLMRATAGIHPHHAAEFPDSDLPALRSLLQDPFVTSAGECGLDYFRDFSPRAEQRRVFAAQLGVAAELGKPVFLHQRDAHSDFMAILADYLPSLPRAVVHCFTGNAEELDAYLGRGLYIGITGWVCDERRGRQVQALVPEIPLERLMLETDGPYLMPRNLQPKPTHRRNETMYLRDIFNFVCTLRREPSAEIAAKTTGNALFFFDLPSISTALAP
jgi:TatD DNase family protein